MRCFNIAQFIKLLISLQGNQKDTFLDFDRRDLTYNIWIISLLLFGLIFYTQILPTHCFDSVRIVL